MDTTAMRVATRGSPLALAQTEWVIEGLRARYPDTVWQIQRIQTEGDRRLGESLQRIGGRGVFVKAIEDALLQGEADVAIHSLKDVPTTLPAGLVIAAVPAREDARDVFIGHTARTPADLPAGARVGTSAPRRMAQWRRLRPDVQVVELRGNVDTRLRKARTGEVDGVTLAAAGLRRLGLWDDAWQPLPFEAMLPAVGQGALAVQCRAADAELAQMLAALNHPSTWAAVTAERAFLRALGGGCLLPIAAHATLTDTETLWLRARVIPPDGGLWEGELHGPTTDPAALGHALAARVPPALRAQLNEEQP